MQAQAKNKTLFLFIGVRPSITEYSFFSLCIIQRDLLYLSWEEAGEASRVPAISMDSGITIYALYKTTILQNKLTESLPLCIEIKHTTYYLQLLIPLNFVPLVNGCCY